MLLLSNITPPWH